ncbi:hypothetical protein C1H76_4163 [Elsinoe australis]|uniref:Uncharacterized protein n=1 Tax=Elsinoe australis TaxID=40998 RepID=A0A4U7AZ36_9PEZI|nr:hypothetical protein C1H76_4163 [Elsinoe australis]
MWDKTRQNWKHSLQKEGNFRHLQTGKHLRAQEARQYTGLKRVMVQEHKATHKPLETYFETLDSEEARCKQLVSVWNELIHRSTSKPEDLHTIIANLLDFHVKNLQQIQTLSESMGTVMSLEQIKAARMRAILLSFSALPLSLLIQRGSHLQPQALSWVQTVPETPLDNSDDMMHIEESEVVIVPGAIRHHSVRILQGHLPENGMLHFRDEKTGLVYSGEIDKLSPTHLWRYPPTFCIIYHTLKRTGALLQITHYSRKRADKTSSAGDYKLHALYLGRVELRIDVSSLSSAVREVYEIPDGWTIGVGIDVQAMIVSLPRRPAPRVYNRAGAGQALLLVLFQIPAYVLVSTFGALQYKEHGGLTRTTAGLMASWLAIWLGSPWVWALFTLLGAPVAHRTWLSSFDDKWAPGRLGKAWQWWLSWAKCLRLNDSVEEIWSDCCGAFCLETFRSRRITEDVEHAMSDEDQRFVRRFNLHEVGLSDKKEEEEIQE